MFTKLGFNGSQTSVKETATRMNPVSREKNPNIVIIGSGAAGISAASKLLENEFVNVKILEAENRIGGRIHTTTMGGILVDMGAQWVHGDIENIIFDMAWSHELLQKGKEFGEPTLEKFYGSSGSDVSQEIANDIFNFYYKILEDITNLESLKTGSIGEYLETRINEFLKTLPDITPDQRKSILFLFNRTEMAMDGGSDWYEVSAKGIRDYKGALGDPHINWKDKGFSTFFDVVMKKIPEQENEIPVIKNTILNARVTKIDYGNEGPVEVSIADGRKFIADHVIFTGSLGVLKENHENLFFPPLPASKINAIKNLGFGVNSKIFLLYDEPWWKPEDNFIKSLLWSDEDRNKIENDPERKWMLGVYVAISIEHRQNLLCFWMSGEYAREMEEIPDKIFENQIVELVDRFFGRDYNISNPKEIKRTTWNTNENIRGSYSYHSVNSDIFDAKNEDLAEPIIRNNRPIIQFAGEATEPRQYSTVHGAVASGFREADRLIELYSHHEKE